MFVIGYAVSSFVFSVNVEYPVAFLMAVAAEIAMVIPIGRVDTKSEFDEDTIQVIENENPCKKQ